MTAAEALRKYLAEINRQIPEEFWRGSDAAIEAEYLKDLHGGAPGNRFHRTSFNLLAHLASVEDDIWLAQFLTIVEKVIPKTTSVIDFGCNIGSLGLGLMKLGYQKVLFTDHPSPATEFLAWRLKARKDLFTPRPQALWADWVCAYDLMEHLPKPQVVFQHMQGLADHGLLCMNKTFENGLEHRPYLHYSTHDFAKWLRTSRPIKSWPHDFYFIYEWRKS